MLSRKQNWKRACKPMKKYYSCNDLQNISSVSEKLDSEDIPETPSLFEWLFSLSTRKIKKSVSFNTYVNVTLIPESCEYKQANLYDQLWYSPEDLEEFKQKTINDFTKSQYKTVKEFMESQYKTN